MEIGNYVYKYTFIGDKKENNNTEISFWTIHCTYNTLYCI